MSIKFSFNLHLQVYCDWLGKLGVLSLFEEMHDSQQDAIVVWLRVQILTWMYGAQKSVQSH